MERTESINHQPLVEKNLSPITSKNFWKEWLEYYNYFLRLSMRWTNGSMPDAEDIVSAVMLKAWREIVEKYTIITNFKFWCTRLLYNDCMEYHRRKGFRRSSSLSVMEYEMYLLVSPERADSQLLSFELLQMTYNGIAGLPNTLVVPLVMRCIRGMSYEQIGMLLKVSVVNARKRVQQARKMLNSYLDDLLDNIERECMDSITSHSEDLLTDFEKLESMLLKEFQPADAYPAVIEMQLHANE